ncbi:MAG: hypothetical protein EZS28_048117, partial [Streblomastix strix]
YSTNNDYFNVQGVPIPQNSIWHVSYRFEGQSGQDITDCGEKDSACQTIEYAIQQISIRMSGDASQLVQEKKIGICEGGYDLLYPLELSKNLSMTEIIKIVKQLNGTSSAMSNNAEIQIYKRDDNYREFGKQGWISAFDGLQLEIYSIDIITDS